MRTIPSLARTSGSTVATSTWFYLLTSTQQKTKIKKLQHLAIQRCIQIGCQCSLYLCSRLHVKAVPTLLSLLRRGTKASCPSSLRRPSEKAGKEKVTGPTAAEVVAESCWTAPWAAASGGWRSRTRTSRRRRSGMVLRSSSRSSRNCRKHLKQRSWVKAETRRHTTFCMSSPQSREHRKTGIETKCCTQWINGREADEFKSSSWN